MQINKISLYNIIEDIDYYLIARKIEPIIIEEWEKTINFLYSNNFPIEITYLNNEFQNKINIFINDILLKYRMYKNTEIINIKDQYYNIKNNLLDKDVKILYRLENNIENNINKNKVLIKIMQTIENNLWNKEDKNIFFFKFDENMIGCNIINNFYETNIINKLYFIDFNNNDNNNDNNLIHKCKIEFKYPSINNKNNKIYNCIFVTWDEFTIFRNKYNLPNDINNKFVISYDKYEDPCIILSYNNNLLDKEKIDLFKNITNNFTEYNDENIIINKKSFIINFIDEDMINNKLINFFKNFTFTTVNNNFEFEINDNDYKEEYEIDEKLSSLKLISKL
jgi:hypothetical protein